ncbi:hypothetical protein DY000_02011361 [Brassica cretica]|uniref:RNase H type-1 domain-containing protein n=1 Tax=Brassica cretica TaxID=69181 RepID=A0ABQ7CQS4_BRACR|nr:hypothetical protein DY000_02011361 [Brassica cretica]
MWKFPGAGRGSCGTCGRNGFLFEGKAYAGEDIIKKAKEESSSWFLAQQIQNQMEHTEARVSTRELPSSHHEVPEGWFLCEFDFDWNIGCDTMGGAWVVKNNIGIILEHSRRAFSGVKSRNEAKLQVWLWVLESMQSMKKRKVRFVSTCGDFVEAIERPHLWSALHYEVSEIKKELHAFKAWELRIGSWESVRSVSFIAQSVKSLGLTQSYVAAGHPR